MLQIVRRAAPPRKTVGWLRRLDPWISSKKYVWDSHGLEHLIGAYWSFDELESRPDEVSFRGLYGNAAVKALEQHMVELAEDWLRKHDRA
jgi:hypothetical protein